MKGANEMARLIQETAGKVYNFNSSSAVLGKINGDFSLKLDNFNHSIPRGDYLTIVIEGNNISPGDRVLVIPIGNSDFVVVGKVR